ncbi:CAP domain-containing protein [Thermomicrobium sp. 4228-Ro]|uniref:CAP domain-containing protein n=1 Tax=Thermomicrobium sp. 4228-Ro TaxID=2993937 RepID=UPI002248EBF1|nr:CAP domain-containing protein [Thermomicrobium sp. 4228-Ro]MCX2726924.1 CAP domain-containing protein [Thermomicrobium sp. 4228-Ro]
MLRRFAIWTTVAAVALVTLLSLAPSAAAASPTGYEVAPVFRDFYQRYGGVPVFGFPLGPATFENGYLVQYFERQRFEYHPEYADTEYAVLLGLLGKEAAVREGRDLRRVAPIPGRRYIAETGHNIAPEFLSYWESRGSVRLFGYPITEPFWENGLLVQYFERARFEYHPDLAGTEWAVLLGRLGAEIWAERQRDVAYQGNSLALQLAQLINDRRRAAGIAPLTLDATLTAIAQQRSDDMARRGYFAHVSPEGRTAFDLIAATGIPWRYAGETLQRNNYPLAQTAAEAARSLFASPSHREILLDPRFTHFGVAEATASDGMHYYTVVLIQQ